MAHLNAAYVLSYTKLHSASLVTLLILSDLVGLFIPTVAEVDPQKRGLQVG